MKTNFDQIEDRRNSDSIKWNKYTEDILPLWVADSDYRAPTRVIQAIQDRLSQGVFGYSEIQEETKSAIQSWVLKRHAWQVNLDDILIVPGVVQAFNITALAFTNPGDSVLVQTPAYRPFLELAENASLVQSTHELSVDGSGNYSINQTDLLSAIDPRTRILMFCNPHNPTGRVFQKNELLQIAEICLAKKIIICSDEIHSDLIFRGHKHIPIASLSEEISASTITLLSPSKTFNLAGLKTSAVIITNPVLREVYLKRSRGLVGSPNLLGQVALNAAYLYGSDWLEELLVYLETNRDILVNFVRDNMPGVNISTPEGTFLGWLDCRDTDLEDPTKHFLVHGKVALSSGDWFGTPYQQYARINFACPREILFKALDRIRISLS